MTSTPRRKEPYSSTQLYNIAIIARTRLTTAACEAEHNLRLLVGHANLLDDLTEALLNCKLEPHEPTSDKWSEALLDLDEDSDESNCGDELEAADLDDQTSSDLEHSNRNVHYRNKHEESNAIVIQPSPRRPAPLLQVIDAMPKLERMKHCPKLASIDEEDAACRVQGTMQAMEAIPVALQAIQAITISAEVDSPTNNAVGSVAPMVRPMVDLVDAPLAALVTAVGAT